MLPHLLLLTQKDDTPRITWHREGREGRESPRVKDSLTAVCVTAPHSKMTAQAPSGSVLRLFVLCSTMSGRGGEWPCHEQTRNAQLHTHALVSGS
jgi:hypothetical protein